MTMRTILTLLVLLVLAGSLPAEPEAAAPPEVVTLRRAAQAGRLEVRGVDPRSYREVTLELRNRTAEPLLVDLCGSYLRPKKKGSCQRLGLGPAITPSFTFQRGPGTVVVRLGPGEKASLRMNTVCLDAGRSSPGRQEFVAATSRLPEVREKVLRWWADHPDAPQSAVNCAIWNFREEVRVEPGVVESYREPAGKRAAARGGTYYRLSDGVLTSLDPGGIERILGSQIFTVHPTPDGVYAVGLGGDGQPELWRLAMTGEEPWGRVTVLSGSARVLDVVPMAERTLALVTDQGIHTLNTGSGQWRQLLSSHQFEDISALRLNEKKLLVALRIPAEEGYWQGGERKAESSDIFELWIVDGPAGTVQKLKRFWNVKAVAAGRAGVFGLTHRGQLRRLVSQTFRTLPRSGLYRRILGVGRNLLWLVREDGRLEAVHASSGQGAHLLEIEPGEDFRFAIDAETDDLVYVEPEAGTFRRISAEDGCDAEVADAE
jgi:hypothetical protein